MDAYINPFSDVQSHKIGHKSRIWQFTIVLPNAVIGVDCNICSHVLIENDVIIGDRVTVKSGVQLWDGLRIEDDVFIGPNVTFTNDPFPRSKQYPVSFAETTVKAGASIGGGGDNLARPNNWPRCHGGGRRSGYKVGARQRSCRRQPCSNRSIHGCQQ